MTLGASTLARKYDQFVNNDALNNFFQTGWQKSLYTSVSKAFQGNQSLFFSYNLNDIAGIVPGNKDQRHSAKLAYDLGRTVSHWVQPHPTSTEILVFHKRQWADTMLFGT